MWELRLPFFMKKILFFDVELMPELFMIGFMNEEGVYKKYGLDDAVQINRLLTTRRLVGYNSQNYDLPILEAVIKGTTLKALNLLSNKIISGERIWPKGKYEHIDLIQIAPGLKISLKLYAGRMHFKTMHELEWNGETHDEALVEKYNLNDLRITQTLYNEVKDKINLRDEMNYKTSMISKSDAQIAEYVFRELIPTYSIPQIDPGTIYKYTPVSWLPCPDFVKESEFVVTNLGSIALPKEMKQTITIGDTVYKMGIGGLHSQEKNIDYTDVEDWDVASFYPSLIMNLGLYPEGLGSIFLYHYQKLIDKRLVAKHNGDKTTNETLKVTINGSFGKLGSKYSCLYSPQLMIQVTITGQLVLLELIRLLEEAGIKVVSANTDGIVVKGDAAPVIAGFELLTGFDFECTKYKRYFGVNCNNYAAIKYDNSVKTKGRFSSPSLTKNPDNAIVAEAVIQNLLGFDGVSHITDCKDITKFLQVRTVRGGGVYNNEYVGKVVRYYHSTQSVGNLQYKLNGNKVPKSDGCVPLMNIGEFPNDIDYDYYIGEYFAWLENRKSKKTTVTKSKKLKV